MKNNKLDDYLNTLKPLSEQDAERARQSRLPAVIPKKKSGAALFRRLVIFAVSAFGIIFAIALYQSNRRAPVLAMEKTPAKKKMSGKAHNNRTKEQSRDTGISANSEKAVSQNLTAFPIVPAAEPAVAPVIKDAPSLRNIPTVDTPVRRSLPPVSTPAPKVSAATAKQPVITANKRIEKPAPSALVPQQAPKATAAVTKYAEPVIEKPLPDAKPIKKLSAAQQVASLSGDERMARAKSLFDQQNWYDACDIYRREMTWAGHSKKRRHEAVVRTAQCYYKLGYKSTADHLLEVVIKEGGSWKTEAKAILAANKN
jgi:hypothetical protein